MRQTDRKKPKPHRAHGDGSLEKRGKKYFARWMVNGKRFTRSTGESSIEKAREKLEEFTRPYRIGSDIDTIAAQEIKIKGREAELMAIVENREALTIDQLYSSYRETSEGRSITKATATEYESVLLGLAKWVRENYPEMIEARRLTKSVSKQYADELGLKYAATTRNIYVRILRKVWRSISRKENLEIEESGKEAIVKVLESKRILAMLDFNPWDDVQSVSTVGKVHSRRELTIDELRRVCAFVTGEMRVLFAIGIYTGLRCGDCSQLDWGDIDLERGIIKVVPRKTKNRSGIVTLIPIHPALRAILIETPENNRIGKVVPECCRTYCRDRNLLVKQIREIFHACGIVTLYKPDKTKRGRSDVGFHSLRHTFVSMAANAGASLDLVRKIVGHTNPAMTRHYFHAEESALRNAVAQLPNVTESAITIDNGSDTKQDQTAKIIESLKTASPETIKRLLDAIESGS